MYSKVGRRKALAGADEGEGEGFEVAGGVECSGVELGDCGVGGIDEFVKSTLWNGCTNESVTEDDFRNKGQDLLTNVGVFAVSCHEFLHLP